MPRWCLGESETSCCLEKTCPAQYLLSHTCWDLFILYFVYTLLVYTLYLPCAVLTLSYLFRLVYTLSPFLHTCQLHLTLLYPVKGTAGWFDFKVNLLQVIMSPSATGSTRPVCKGIWLLKTSQSVIDSFRFGDSYCISELCEHVYKSIRHSAKINSVKK